jgi:predicted ATPase
LPATPALRRKQIELQVALMTPLIHLKGYAAEETRAAAERARLLIERAEALGEPLQDPLLLFSVLYGFWVANYVAFNGDRVRELAAQFLALAEKHRATFPLMVGHRLMGISLLDTGGLAEGRAHFDQAIALYDPAEHRALATRFGQDPRVATLCLRSWALWSLGYPEAALADADQALADAREIGQAGTLMVALTYVTTTYVFCGNYAAANPLVDELVALAGEKGTVQWKAWGMMNRGFVSGLTGKALVDTITSGIAAWRSTGATVHVTLHVLNLARAYAELGQYGDAWRCIGEAMTEIEASKETLFEADVHRTAGEIALLSLEPDAAKAEACFERALAIARAQQAKSWELRAATSLARLWRDQGKRDAAHAVLAPVYGWFTEGVDTRDLIEARALLDGLPPTACRTA